MIRFLINFSVTVLVLVASIFVYRLATITSEDYNLFDLVRGESLAPATARPILGQLGNPVPLVGDLDPGSLSILSQYNDALANLTEAVVPSVVSIDTTKTINVQRVVPADPWGLFGYRQNSQMERPGLGSGAIVSSEGHIITNHHVVAGVDEIQVTTHDGEKYEAELIGSEPNVDIAVLKIKQPDARRPVAFRPLAFGDSGKVRVGEMALAIGNPFGLSETVTRGIISAKQRQLSDGANEYFQVDAVINPGNSGGPLVNYRGEIIGVNVAIFTGQQNVKVWQGIGLAVPSNEASEIYRAIVHGQPLERGFLGVGMRNLSEQDASFLKLPNRQAVLITDVAEESPAEVAGIEKGDVVLSFDGKEVNSAREFIGRISRMKKGESARVRVFRNGEILTVEPVFTSMSDPNSIQLKRSSAESGQSITEALGIDVQDLNRQQRYALGLGDDIPAIAISEVAPGSPAATRFRAGDLIHRVNDDYVNSVKDFFDLLGSLPRGRKSIMILSRNGQRFDAVLSP